jgi:hypothetical protein
MVSEYRFLRFEIAGLTTVTFYILMTWPLVANWARLAFLKDLGLGLAVVAALFLISLPLGYWEHQLVVNRYRSEKKARKVHQLLEHMILEDPEIKAAFSQGKDFFGSQNSREKNAFLTTLIELVIYSGKIDLSPEIYERLGDRWSHFYARKAVSQYAPVFSLALWAGTVLLGYFSQWPLEWGRAWLSIVVLGVIGAVDFALIDPYSRKIWLEITFLEVEMILAYKDKVGQILSSIVKSEHLPYLTGVG